MQVRPDLAVTDAGASPQVSVIVAAYNCAPYIGVAIESALAQVDTRVEVIVVDDASTDGTADVARAYESSGRVRVVVNAANAGPSASRNRALALARGQWVVQLDGDDWMAPDRVRRLLAAAAQAAADFVIDDQLVVEHASMRAFSTRFVDKNVPWHALTLFDQRDLVRYDLGSMKPLMNRDFVQRHALRYPEHVRYGEDFIFLLRAMRAGARFAALPQPMYRLRRGNTGSLTTQKSSLYAETERSTRQMLTEDEVLQQPAVRQGLEARLRYLQQLAALSDFKLHLRRGAVHRATAAAIARPGLLLPLAQHLPNMLAKRLRRVGLRQALATFEPPVLQGAEVFSVHPQQRG